MKVPIRWLLALLLVPAAALAPAAASAQSLVEGQDYVRLTDAGPWQPLDGQIEVAEIFSYGCSVCHDFRPMLDAWARRQPDDVRVSHVPAARAGDPFATVFFAAEAIGEHDTVHAATFDALHRRGILARNATLGELATFYAGLGVDREQLAEAIRNPETAARVKSASEFLGRSGAQGTPTLVINGKYRVQGRTLGDVLRIAEQLIAIERTP